MATNKIRFALSLSASMTSESFTLTKLVDENMNTFRSRFISEKCIVRFVSTFLFLIATIPEAKSQNFWQQTNGPYGGDIQAIAIHPVTQDIFTGTGGAGVLRSTNNGDTWIAANTGLTNSYVFALAINSSGQIFAGTIGGGVFRSTDNGNSWTGINSGLPNNTLVFSLLINSSGHIFAGTDGGVFRSMTNGDTWIEVNSGLTNATIVYDLAININGNIFVGTNDGVFRSTNNGGSWIAVNTGLPKTFVLALAINSTGHIFAGINYGGVFRSINNGENWAALDTSLTNTDVRAFAINASGHIFAGTDRGVFRSTNDGNIWAKVNSGLPEDTRVYTLAINSSGHIFAGSARSPLAGSTRSIGIFRSTDNGDSWITVNTGLTNTFVLTLAINSRGHIFAGTWGGGVFRSTDNGDNWTEINSGLPNTDFFALAINSSGHIFVGSIYDGVFRSMNNGDSWAAVNDGFTSDYVGINVRTFVINSSDHIFVGISGGVFRSMNNGDSWTKVNSGFLIDPSVFALAINSSGHVFAGTYDGAVYRSTNNGEDWTFVSGFLNIVQVLAINASGDIFAGTQGGGVFRSTNNGEKWTAINSGLPNTDVRALAINSSGHIFAAISGDVYRSTNNGDNWTAVNSGLAEASAYALAINASGHIFTGTYERGVFRSVQSTLVPFANTTSATNVNSSAATLSGTVNPNGLSTNVFFEYGTSAGYGNTIPAIQTPVEGTNTVSVSATVTDLTLNTLYHYRVIATNSAGTSNGLDQTFTTTLPAYPSSFNLSTTVSFPSLPNASNYKATDYRIVGLPGASNRSVRDFFAGEPNKDWQAYWDNGASSNFFVAYDGSSRFQFSVGRAFWLINKGSVNINTTVPSAPLNAAQELVIPLQSGWNLITNPFPTAIAWSKIQAADTLGEPIYSFNGSFSESSTFEPYVGYYFFNATNRSSLKIPYSLLFSTVAATDDPAIWRVNISFSSGEIIDNSTSFGIASETSRNLDRFDFRKPRALAAMPTVEFKRPQWDERYSTFATDVRPKFEAAESWEFDVRAISRQPAQLTFAGIKKIPSHFEVYLIDEARVQSANLREDSLYHFTPAAELMKFKVVVGRKENVQEQLSALALPKDFALGPNYPNPFNPTTTIPIAVPAASEIKLKIYNILGAEIKTLYDGTTEAGRYWFNWDGRNEMGIQVATGVYLYRFTTSKGLNLMGKMILMR